MYVNGLYISNDTLSVLTKLKTDLQEHNISLFAKMFDSGEDVMVCCPYHKDGQERRPSAGIRKSDGLFHCLACGKTVSFCEMISDCFGYHDALGSYGYKWLSSNFLTVNIEERDDVELDLDRTNKSTCGSTCVITEDELDKYRYTHPYLYKRGITDAIIELFDVGYDKQTDSITFPVKDINGDCIFVARRSVKHKHFDLPKGINKPLYGLYEAYFNNKVVDKIYVCEGLFDCLRLWCVGKYAVAGFGCLFSSYQIKQLQDLPCRTIVLALDNDDAGDKATNILQSALTNKLVYKAIIPSNRKDVGECTDEELNSLEEILL